MFFIKIFLVLQLHFHLTGPKANVQLKMACILTNRLESLLQIPPHPPPPPTPHPLPPKKETKFYPVANPACLPGDMCLSITTAFYASSYSNCQVIYGMHVVITSSSGEIFFEWPSFSKTCDHSPGAHSVIQAHTVPTERQATILVKISWNASSQSTVMNKTLTTNSVDHSQTLHVGGRCNAAQSWVASPAESLISPTLISGEGLLSQQFWPRL